MIPILLAFFLFLPSSAWPLNFGLSAAHYAEAMEFYYQRPKPALLAPMVRVFAQAGNLGKAEQRLFVAAFLATLVRNQGVDPEKILPVSANHDQELLLAWTLRLSGRDTSAVLAGLPGAIADQIRNAPARLEDWDPGWESSVLGMFWAAFMASGDAHWIDRIIALALQRPPGDMAQKAAAALYDYAPAHPLVQARLRAWLPRADASAKSRLERMLGKPAH